LEEIVVVGVALDRCEALALGNGLVRRVRTGTCVAEHPLFLTAPSLHSGCALATNEDGVSLVTPWCATDVPAGVSGWSS